MAKGPWLGNHPIGTRWRYSSGAGHFSWDVPMPIGTPLYAIGNGVIVDCNDGVPDQPIGRPAGTGAPSNWIILKFKFPAGPYKGKIGYAYYQHLTKGGVKVRKGQKVKKRELIGKSGNSGNTTGPHLHLTILKPGYTMNRWNRYAYLSNPNMVVWEPGKAWGQTDYDRPVYRSKLKPGVDNSKSVYYLRKELKRRGLFKPAGNKIGNKYTPAVEKAVKVWQRRNGFEPTGKLKAPQFKELFGSRKRNRYRLV